MGSFSNAYNFKAPSFKIIPIMTSKIKNFIIVKCVLFLKALRLI